MHNFRLPPPHDERPFVALFINCNPRQPCTGRSGDALDPQPAELRLASVDDAARAGPGYV